MKECDINILRRGKERMSMAAGSKRRRKPWTREQKILLCVAVVFMLYIFAFSYMPLFGWGLSLFNYKPALGMNLAKQKWVGMSNFVRLWTEREELVRVLRNTLSISGLGILCSPLGMILAIMFAELRSPKLLRVTQTVTTFPNFISWVIVYGICYTIFSNDGLWGKLVVVFTGKRQEFGFLSRADTVYIFHTILGVWKGVGWGSIIYCAAIAGIDESLYEAARIDGADRLRQIWHVTLPGLRNTYMVLLLLDISNILSNGFDRYFVFYNPMVAETITVLDLWTYQLGFQRGNYGFSIAAGMMKTLVSLILLFSTNMLSKKIRGQSIV